MTDHKKQTGIRSLDWLLQREREMSTGSADEGADGGVTLRERRSGRHTVAGSVSFQTTSLWNLSVPSWWVFARVRLGYMISAVKIQ